MGFLAGYLAAQLRILLRSRSTLFWVVVFPLIMTLLFTSLWGKPATPKIDLGLVVEDEHTAIVEGIVRGINATPMVDDLIVLDSREELLEQLRAPPPRGVDVGIVVPQGFSRNISTGRQACLELLYLDTPSSWTNTSLAIARGIVDELSRRIREHFLEAALRYTPQQYRPYVVALAEPVKVRVEPVEPETAVTEAQVKAWIALSMAVVEALFIGLLVGATSFHEEKRLGMLPALLSSPLGSWSLLAARLLTALLYTGIASAVAIAAGALAGAEYSASPAAVAVAAAMIALATLFSASIGLVISGLAKRQEAAEAMANAVAFPLMFIGGIWVPKWMLPPLLQRLAEVLPVSRMADAARAVIVYGQGPGEALAEHTPPTVLAATAVFLAIGVLLYRRLLEKSIEHPG
ncbi:ABC transporter permease [Pyrodictium abyssi]|uniref:ABC transmembrane type-2 domain-containing protein n=1 Tax=Pyrodictium abyssi TaxID=54256 RepID=A0ABM8J0M7_9CREN|nr:hypothetical protein PABY_19870 [Pyrodictium abyssi]